MPYYVSKERVERDGYLVYAEGDEIPSTDVDELKRQGYTPEEAVEPAVSHERVERDGVLVYAEGDVIPDTDVDELARQGYETAKGPAKSASKADWAAHRAAQGHDVEDLTKEQLVELPDQPAG